MGTNERQHVPNRGRVGIPHFRVVPAIVAETDTAGVLPRRIATQFANAGRFMIPGVQFFHEPLHGAAVEARH